MRTALTTLLLWLEALLVFPLLLIVMVLWMAVVWWNAVRVVWKVFVRGVET